MRWLLQWVPKAVWIEPLLQEQIKAIDLCALEMEKQDKVKTLLWSYQFVFSAHDSDLRVY